jgi:hypothetical protein
MQPSGQFNSDRSGPGLYVTIRELQKLLKMLRGFICVTCSRQVGLLQHMFLVAVVLFIALDEIETTESNLKISGSEASQQVPG